MDTFEEIAHERRALADQLADLTPQQRATPSLCHGWTVHDVLAHLVMPLEVSTPRMVLAVLTARGNFDRANQRMTQRLAQRPHADIIEVLRRKAGTRFTPPGAGPEAPLVDVLVHGLDICWPLQLAHHIPQPRLTKALNFLATSPSGLVPAKALTGLRLHASDITWAHGAGPVVQGSAQALLLACTGRTAALDSLDGEGVPILRGRLTTG